MGRWISQESVNVRPSVRLFRRPHVLVVLWFPPVIAALAERFEGRLGLQLVMGGLRAGHAVPMRDGFRPLDDLLEPLERW